MKKRIAAWTLCLTLILTSMSTAAFAANTILMVKTPATIPKAGEMFAVTVEIAGNPGFCSAQFTLNYDRDAMNCTAVETGPLLAAMRSVTNADAADGAVVAAAFPTPALSDGVLATFRFVAKTGVERLDFALRDVEFSDSGGETFAVSATTATAADPPTATAAQGGAARTDDAQTTETPANVETAFADTAGHWGEQWIAEAARRGLFKGDNGRFRPDEPIKRGDFVLVLYRMAGEPEVTEAAPFADVAPDAYYAKAVAWAYANRYVGGKGAGFAPQDGLTRQEAMKILFGYAGARSGAETMFTAVYDDAYPDSGEIADWGKAAMYWAVYRSIIDGMDGRLNPRGVTTRAQISKILVEYLEKTE